MYRLSPYTYLIEALLGQALGKRPIQCADVELVMIQPPSGESCSSYMDSFISLAGGYLPNPDATSNCQYCEFSSTDAFLETSFNIFYSHHWRDMGIFAAFICFNVGTVDSMLWCIGADCWLQIAATYGFTYIFRIKKGRGS